MYDEVFIIYKSVQKYKHFDTRYTLFFQLPLRMKTYTEFDLATWLRLVKFTELILNILTLIFELQLFKLLLRDT